MSNISENSKFSLWPLGIVVMVTVLVILIIFTVRLALSSNLDLDNRFMIDDYRSVDESYNELQHKLRNFNTNFNVNISENNRIAIDSVNRLEFDLSKKDGSAIENANIILLATRPHTSEDDFEIEVKRVGDYSFISSDFDIDKPGRWLFVFNINIDDYSGFFRQELNASI